MSTPTIHPYPSPLEAAQALADFVAQRLRHTLAQRGHALLVVSGGSTPLPFFAALSRSELDWSQVWVTLADERWVAPDHAHSNERLVRTHLLRNAAAAAHFVPLKNAATTPEEGLAQTEAQLQAIPWPAVVMVLGVGEDGHTASLFPHAPQWLAQASKAGLPNNLPRCCAVAAPVQPNVPVARLSLTPSALLEADVLVIHAQGTSKWAVLQQAMQPGPVADLPVRWVLHQDRVPCHIFTAV